MAALQVSENWDEDFEFQVEKRKISTATAKSEATENWDDDFEDSRQSPKKIIQRYREESWDDEDNEDDDDENSEFGSFAEEDRTVTANSRRTALARLAPDNLPHSPASSVFSVPTTIHTYSSTAHLRPTSAFALIPPSPPIHKERERRRLRKKSRPKPQAIFELVEIPSQERPSFSDVDLPRPASELDSTRRTSRSDLSIHDHPPLVVSAVAETSIVPSNGPVSIPHTPTKGATLLSRIGSVKKWGVRRKRGDSTAQTDANESFVEREPISSVSKWDPRRTRRDSTTPADTIPTGSRSRTEEDRGGRRGASTKSTDHNSNDCRNEHDPRSTPRASSSLSYRQQECPLPPAKLVKKKSFGFVHLGRRFGGHGGGENDVMGQIRSRDADEEDGEGKLDVIEKAGDQKDRMKYTGLGVGRVGGRGDGGDKVNGDDETSGSPQIEKRNRRRSLSLLLMDRDKEDKGNTNGMLEKEGARSFMGSMRRISLISVGVVGRHRKTKSSGGGFLGVGSGGGPPARIPSAPTALPPALNCASQVSPKIPSNMASGQRSTSSHTPPADLRRSASFSSRSGGDGSNGPTATSAPATPIRSNSRNSRPPSISSSTKRRPRARSKSKSKPRKSDESSQDAGVKTGLDFQQEQLEVPFFYPPEDALLKTPTRSASSTVAATISSLLPPIELHLPSPPRTATTSHIQRRSRAYTTNEVIEGLELESLLVTPSTSSSLAYFTPTSSLSGSNVEVGAVEVGGILPLPSLSPKKLSAGKSPSQSQQSVSLGRSTTVNVVGAGDEVTGLLLASGIGSGGGGGLLPRRNSLGDLKIPVRISQAQVGLRRDLGMVREFASNVEQLKELQNTYNALAVEVRTLLDTHVHLRQRVPLPPQPQPVEKYLPPSASFPKFLTQLKSRPQLRARSNTVGSTTHSPDVDSASLDVAVTASQVAYNRLLEGFWSINYKYRVSWECAELLIELGSGSGGDGDGDGVISAPLSAATTSVSALAVQQYLAGTGEEGTIFDLKGREKSITLANDRSKHSTTPLLSPPVHHEPHTHCQSQPSSAIVSTGSDTMPSGRYSGNATSNGGPPIASPLTSPPSMFWRASTGRHDLSQRQLVLLREMLNNKGGASIVGASDNEGGPQFPSPADELCPSTMSPYPSPYSQFVNRDWRWGDARNSTITFSDDQESGFGAEGGRRDRKIDKEKKRRSVKLGIGGIRDMLRSLKKGHLEELQQIGNSNPGEVQSTQQCNHLLHDRLPSAVALAQPMMHSTTSLSTESSIDSKSVHNQAQVHQQQNRLPISRIPSQIRRRGSSSTGPESMGSNKGPSPASFNHSSVTSPKTSPRRPSLASIFKIGNNKTRPAVLHTGVDVVDPATLSSAFSASEHDLSVMQCHASGRTTGTGEYCTGKREKDWDRMVSVSDLDADAIKALGIVDGTYDVSATVRGRGKAKIKADEKVGISYLQNQSSYEDDQHHLPPFPALSSSTGLGNFLARHSIIPKRSFSVPQSSILGSAGGDGQQHSPNAPSRLSRHSNFEEQSTDTADNEPPASFRISFSKSAPATTQSKLPGVNFSASSAPVSFSRPSSRSTKSPNAKTGSVRSMPPHVASSSLPLFGLQGQQPSPLSSLPDSKLGVIMTPENIKPLLENAKEVHVKLHECIVEIRTLIDNGAAAIGHTGVAQVLPTT